MRGTKIIVTIVVEVLSVDSVLAIASDAVQRINNEFPDGELHTADGDNVRWNSQEVGVNF